MSRRGFTLIEMVVATFLIALLGTLLALSWKAFGIPAVQVEARARLALSANLAAASLAQDMGGSLLKREGKANRFDLSDPVQVYRVYVFDSWQPSEDQHEYPVRLRFRREDQQDTILTISYYVEHSNSTLVRVEEEFNSKTTVATHITDLRVVPFVVNMVRAPFVSYVKFTVTYGPYWQYEGEYTLIVKDPQ
jgi:prepilin-type N-terminal cleavage/methylation domain-containing protein